MKPGYKTTEFWISSFASLVGIFMSSGLIESTSTQWDNRLFGLITTGLAAAGYSISRGLAKH